MSSLDTENLRTLTESNLSWSPHYHMPYRDGKDSVSAASMLQARRSAKEHMPHSLHMQVDDARGRYFLSHKPLDSEHRLLSSTPKARSSLHSEVRSRAGSSEGRFRVSFSEDSSSDVSLGGKETRQKLDLLDFGWEISPTRRLNSNDAGKLNSYRLARDLRLGSYESLCLASSTPHRDLLADDKKAANSVHHYSSKFAKEALAATRFSCRGFRGQCMEIDSDPESSLKHNSDAKLNNLSTSAGLGDFRSKCTSVLNEKALEELSMTQRGREPPVSRSLSLSRLEFKHSRSPTHGFKKANKEHQCNEQKSRRIWTESPLSAKKSSPVVVVLRKFLELVDRYWDGSGSLLLNKDFLAPAHDLLMNLMAAAPSQQDSSFTAVAAPSSNSRGTNYRIPTDPPKDSQHFRGVDKPMKPEDGQVTSFKELSKRASATLNYNPQGKHPLSYDELLIQNQQLSAQVHVLTSEVNQLKNQQDTIKLLQESQTSLVSTNTFLLQLLNKAQGPSSAKEAHLSEKTTASANAPFFERISHHAPSSSAFGSSQPGSLEQLSRCPL